MAFLHGVETVVVDNGPVPVTVVKSAVIAIVGTAPTGDENELTLVNNPVEAAQFGSAVIPGFTIPKSLKAIFDNGGAAVEVVNVYDPATHNDTETNEAFTVAGGKFKPDNFPLDNIEVQNQASQTLTAGTHYNVNAKGEVVLTNSALVGITAVGATGGSFRVTGGTNSAGVNKITQITVNSVNLMAAAVDWATSNDATATAVAAAITQNGYTATATGSIVSIVAPSSAGASVNTLSPVVTVGGDVTVGSITAFSGGVTGLTATTSGTITYDWFNPSNVTSSDIIGAVTGGDRTGFELFDLSFNEFGFIPKILIAPGFSQLTAVRAAMETKAAKYRAKAIIDGVEGWTVANAIADRGPAGGPFNTADKNSFLVYPLVKRYDAYTDDDELFPFSPFMAGVIANTDLTKGFWKSPSNELIKGITGVERQLTFAVNDQNTEVNQLNAAGITTIANAFGTGFRTWGNRSAAYPSSTAVTNFLCVDRTAYIIDESLEQASLQFVDLPLNQPLIDSIRETGNAFMRSLISRGAIIDGNVSYDPAKNPPTQLAAGQIVFDVTFLPPTPAERITYERFIDINFFNNLA